MKIFNEYLQYLHDEAIKPDWKTRVDLLKNDSSRQIVFDFTELSFCFFFDAVW